MLTTKFDRFLSRDQGALTEIQPDQIAAKDGDIGLNVDIKYSFLYGKSNSNNNKNKNNNNNYNTYMAP